MVCSSPPEMAGLPPDQLHCVPIQLVHLPVVPVCLVIMLLSLSSAIFFICLRRPRPVISDYPPPPYYIHGYDKGSSQGPAIKMEEDRWMFAEDRSTSLTRDYSLLSMRLDESSQDIFLQWSLAIRGEGQDQSGITKDKGQSKQIEYTRQSSE